MTTATREPEALAGAEGGNPSVFIWGGRRVPGLFDWKCKKRNQSVVPFDADKIHAAVLRCFKEVAGLPLSPDTVRSLSSRATELTQRVVYVMAATRAKTFEVETIQRFVIQQLWAEGLFAEGESYQNYREHRRKVRDMETAAVFGSRLEFKPFDYPGVVPFKKAIQKSAAAWTASEFDFISDTHDMRVHLTPAQQSAAVRSVLAISQVEVDIKRFWKKLGDRLNRPEFEQVGVVFAECHVDGTEILTPTGWVDLSAVKVGDKVAEYRPDGTFEFVPAQHVTTQHYSGDMVRFYKASTATVVTPNHRMVYFDEKGRYLESTAESLNVRHTKLFLPEAGRRSGGTVNTLSDIDRLRIAIQADGNRRFYVAADGSRRARNPEGAEYVIRIRKPRKIERLDEILSKLPLALVSRRPIPSRPGMICYTVRTDGEFDYKTFDWVHLGNKTADWCRQFCDEVSRWDGNDIPSGKDCRSRYNSTEKGCADKVQAVGVLAGYRTNRTESEDQRVGRTGRQHKTSYHVSFTANRERVTLPPLKRELVPYSGTVRCVTVPSGAIVTRLNGKTFIAGNSEVRHCDAYSKLLDAMDLNDRFRTVTQVPAVASRIEYLRSTMKSASTGTDKDFIKSVAAFSLLVENVSLFSQFAVVKSFSRKTGRMQNLDNTVQATMREELVHAMFGAWLTNTVKAERPEWFDRKFYDDVAETCRNAFAAENSILDWIFAEGDVPSVSRKALSEFVKDRVNVGMGWIGGDPVFETDASALGELDWFQEELSAPVDVDFFHKKSTNYSVRGVTAADLFD